MSIIQNEVVEGGMAAGTNGMVFSIQRFSTEDGPGVRTTVFMKGCVMKCPWCQNPEGLNLKPDLVWYPVKCIAALECVKICGDKALALTRDGMIIDRKKCIKCNKCVEACPSGALELIGKTYTKEDLIDEALRDRVFYETSGGGVTFSGGEPLMQIRFLEKILPALKDENIHIAIDTCGAVPWKHFERIIKYVDLFLYDLKLFDKEKLKEIGGDLGLILDNAKNISDKGIPMWIRTPIIPGFTDSEENVRNIAEFIAEDLPVVERYDLLAFNNMCKSKYERLDMDWELKDMPLIKKEKMERLKSVAETVGLDNVRWSGLTREVD